MNGEGPPLILGWRRSTTCTSKEGVKKPSKVVAIGCWVQLHLTTHVVFKWRTEVKS
ncbi:unnamed protein product [Musa acuminata var. zebrina]